FAASSGPTFAQFVPTPSIGGGVKYPSFVESTSWSPAPKPYYQGNLLVVNSTGTSTGGQYIAWYFTPSTTTLNVTIHVVSFPVHNNDPGIGLLSPNIGNQSSDEPSGTYMLEVDFYGGQIAWHGLSGGWNSVYSGLPQPNPNYPFTFTVIFTENSAGNVTVAEVGINGTYTTVNFNTEFPWTEIGYVEIRGDWSNLFYVSYFAASSGPVSAQFVPPRELQYPPFVESTGWGSSPKPYYQGNLLVFNTTGVGNAQYIAWAFTPSTTTLNVTIHVVSFPDRNVNPGIDILSPSVGNQSSDNNLVGFYEIVVDIYDSGLFYHGPSTGWQTLYSSLPQPNPNYPFTFTVILTENSAGNVTVAEIGINGTYTTINVNTPFPWSQLGYIGLRADPGNLIYVSYFAASTGQPGTYPVVFVPSYTVNANPFPIFRFPSTITQAYLVYNNNTVFLSSIDAGGQFFLNIPLKMQWEPFSYFGSLSAYQLLTVVNAPTTGYLAAFPYPLTHNYFTSPGPFTSVPSTVITPTFSKTTYPLTNVSIQQLTLFTSAGSVVTSTQAYVLPNIGAWTYASVQYPTSVSVIVNNTVQKLSVSGASVTVSASYSTTVIAPDNLIPPPNAQVSVYNATFNKIVISSTSTFTFSTQIIQSGLPTFGLVLPVWYYVSLGTGTIGVPLVQVPMILGNKLFTFLPAVESTGWGSSPRPYYQGNLLVVNSTSSPGGQYIAWYFVPTTTTLNLTIHVVSFPVHNNAPGVGLLSPNIGNQSSDEPSGTYMLQVAFYNGYIAWHGLAGGWDEISSSAPQPNPNYPFTFSVIFTENSAGNVTISEIGINGTYTTVNINTEFPWVEIGYVEIRGDWYALFYVSYFSASSGPTSITFISPSYIFLNSWASSYVVPSYLNTPYALPYSVSQSSAQVGQYTLTQGLNYVSYSFTPGYVATAILYYNSTPVLANLLSPYISYKFSSLTLSFSTATAAMFSNFPIPAPQLLSNYIPAGSVLYQDPIIYYISPTTVTMYNTTVAT
ncbi:MAG: hypothetical protein QW578_07975, partial [Thermoplasmatales archaeon]